MIINSVDRQSCARQQGGCSASREAGGQTLQVEVFTSVAKLARNDGAELDCGGSWTHVLA